MLEVGFMLGAELSLILSGCLAHSKGPGGQDILPSLIYLESRPTQEVGRARFSMVASLPSLKPARVDEGQGSGAGGGGK